MLGEAIRGRLEKDGVDAGSDEFLIARQAGETLRLGYPELLARSLNDGREVVRQGG